MRKKTFLAVLLVAALAVPVATAAKGKKKETYNLKGTLSAYIAPVDATPGSITILVTKANKAGRAVVGQTLTFVLDSTTEIEPLGTTALTDGSFGQVQLKAAPKLDATGLMLVVPKKVAVEVFAVAPVLPAP